MFPMMHLELGLPVLTLRARLITQTAVGVVNELGTSMGPWYWLDWRSESSHCEFATFALLPNVQAFNCLHVLALSNLLEFQATLNKLSRPVTLQNGQQKILN